MKATGRGEPSVFECWSLVREKLEIWSGALTHQHINIEHPAVFSRTDTEAPQVHAVFVLEDFVERVANLCPQLLTSSSLKFRGCIC